MICEIACLPIREGRMNDFREGWADAEKILARQPGYLMHEIGLHIESPNTVALLIRWRSLEAHTEAFAQSADFPVFINLFSKFIVGSASAFICDHLLLRSPRFGSGQSAAIYASCYCGIGRIAGPPRE
jgi:hypothetical protein